MSSEKEIDAELLLDRLVSASNSEDVLHSLEGLMQVGAEEIVQYPDVLDALLQVYANSYKNLNIEDGPSAVTQLYLHMIDSGDSDTRNALLNEPEEGRLLETAIDVVSDSHMADYTRVLGLQLIRKLSRSKYCLNQLLSAPNGLHRLGDLLRESDMIRNEMLQLSMILSKFSSVAKIWMFSEVADVILGIVDAEGGLSGSVIVVDCLTILKNMLGHDAALADLVFQSPIFIPHLSKLLDLRNAAEFRNPPKPPVSDDLDDLIQSKAAQAVIIPKLKESEETIIGQVFEILSVVLENESVKTTVWKNHGSLATLIWELGLIAPPPQPPFPCAFPSVDLQCKALDVMARYFNDYEILNQHSGMDRLLYLVCTGGPSKSLSDKMKISQSSLFVIRQSLTDVTSNEILMQGLAPPMEGSSQPPVVMKLLNTALENLGQENADVARQVFLAGSLSALGLFLTDEARRSILYRVTAKDGESKLLNGILKTLETEPDEFVLLYLLRFLGQWIMEAPMIVQEMLKNANTILLELFKSDKPAVSGLAGMLLGLCMEYMGDDESLCGGWTRSSLLKVVSPVSRFTNVLEAIKMNVELPWRYCSAELNIWKEWYDQVVLVIRKRLVSQLTSAGDQTETVDSSEVQSMQKLVADQAKELDELRAQAVTAERTIQAQAKELASWKQRVESNPTQLDEMLNEYTTKNSELDQTILRLQDEISACQQSHADELKKRDEKFAVMEQQLSVAQNALAEAEDERDSLREDMEALSQAYTSLEEEYRRQQSQSASTPTAEAPNEVVQHQQQGEESSQHHSGSTEVATLRAENSRLRQDAKAADEWMSMAVERMDTMATEATTYQEQISSLQAQLASNGDVTALQLSQETEARLRLERELAASSKALESERNQRMELENHVESTRVEYENVYKMLQESNEERERLQKDIQELQHQALFSEKQVSTDEEQLTSLKTSIESMREEVDAARAELKSNLEREQYEISARDARIRELEAMTASATQDPTDLALENQQLREANDAAQDWMNKAVEHHRLLSEQVSILTQKNAELTDELESLKNSSSVTGTEPVNTELQTELYQKDSEIETLRDEIARLQEAVESYNGQVDALDEIEKALKKKQVEFENLRAASVVKDQEIELLRSQVVSPSVVDSIESLQSEVTEKETMLASLQAEVEELRSRENELLQRIADFEATRVEVGTTKEEIEQLRARAAEAEGRQASIEKILEVVAKEKEELASEAQKNRDALEKIEKELTELRSADLDVSQSSDWRESMKEALEDLESQLKQQREEATGVIEQWQETYEALQRQHSEISEQLQEALSEKNTLNEELARTSSELETLREQTTTSPDVSNENAELKKLVDNLKEQLSDQEAEANDTIQQWQDSYNEVQARLESLIADKNELDRKLEEARGLENSVSSLQEQLASSNELVLQWEERCNDLQRQIAVDGQQEQTDALLEEKNARIEALENMLTELRTSHDRGGGQDAVARNGEELDGDLNSIVANLKEQLADQIEESRQTISEWETAYSEIEQQLAIAQEKLQTVPEVDQPDGADLQEQLAKQENEANDIIAQWQRSYEDVSAQLEKLTAENETLIAQLQTARGGDENLVPSGSQTETDQLAEIEVQLRMLQDQLAQQEEDANNVISQWQQSYEDVSNKLEAVTEERAAILAELEAARERLDRLSQPQLGLVPEDQGDSDNHVEALQEQLEEQAREATEMISQWQESYDDVVSQLNALTDEKAMLLAELEETKQNLERIKAEHSHPTSVRNTGENLDDRVKALQEELEKQEEDAANVVSQWQESYNAVVSDLEVLSKERNELMQALESYQISESASKESAEIAAPQTASTEDELRELQKRYEDVRSELEASKNEKASLLEELQSLAEPQGSDKAKELEALQAQLLNASTEISHWQEKYADALQELSALRETLEESGRPAGDSGTMDASQRSAAEEHVEDLQSRLAEQEDDTAKLNAQWEESYNEIQAQLRAIENEQLKPLQEQLAAKERESEEALDELKARYGDVVDQLSKATAQNESLLSELEDARKVKSELAKSMEDKVASLESQISDQQAEALQIIRDWEERFKGMEDDFEQHMQNADRTVSQWSESYDMLKAENEELIHDLKQAQQEFQIASDELKRARSSVSLDAQEIDTEGIVEDLQRKFDASQSECRARENQIKKLTDQVSNKDEIIQELRREADSAKSSTSSTRVDAANQRIKELLEEKYDLQCALDEAKIEKQRLSDQLDQVQDSLRSELDQVKSASDLDLQAVNAELATDREKLYVLEAEIDDYRSKNASLEHKNKHLESRVSELEDELREVDANLQLHLTNMVMAKGSEEAKDILMRQLEETRERHHEDKRALLAERETREAAESEVKRLKADLAAVLGMDESDGDHSTVQQKLAEAKENFQRAERAEIEALKKSLSRALDELEDARNSEKELQNRAAKANHLAVVYEQEIINTKSDFGFLSRTVDEIRDTESSKRASLEYRISALENEKNVQQRFHNAELENLRNELNQISMERDRLFQAVKESEKSRDALLQAKHINIPVGDVPDPYAELAQLRIEKAQLLSAASEEAARIERRLRETRAAAKASSEAEVILEKELRVAAEKSLESAMLEVHQLRAEKAQLANAPDSAVLGQTIDTLEHQLNEARAEIDRLTTDYKLLVEETEKQERENASRLERLTKECQQTKARLNHLERDGRYEAEVRAEMERLRTTTTPDGVLVNMEPAEEESESDDVVVGKLYEVIDKQKQAIKEERTVYFNLVKEHDDLLALLAQENLIKESLSGALARVAGQPAVVSAIEEAENKAKEQYRKYVKIS